MTKRYLTLDSFLDDWINADNVDDSTNNTVSYQNLGPGNLDKWGFVEGRRNCWQQRGTVQSQQKKKKIIISHGLLYDAISNVSLMDYRTFSHLIDKYEVYLWPGNNSDFSNCKPLNSASELWQHYTPACAATSEQVKEKLSEENIDTNDFIILDYAVYCDLLNIIKKDVDLGLLFSNLKAYVPRTRDTLWLDKVPENLKTTEQVLDYIKKSNKLTDIKYLILDTPSAQEISCIPHLPNLEKIKVNNISEAWQQKPHGILSSNLDIKYTDRINKANKLSIAGNQKAYTIESMQIRSLEVCSASDNSNNNMIDNLEELHVLNCEELQEIKIAQEIKLKKLELSGLMKLDNNIKQFQELEELKIDHCSQFNTLDLKAYPHLKKLHLEFTSIRHVDLTSLSELEELEIVGCDMQSLDFSNCRKLKRLVLKKLPDLEQINIEQLPELEELRIRECPNLNNPIHLEESEKLKLLETYGSNLQDIIKLKNETYLQLKTISEDGISEEKYLKELTISGFQKKRHNQDLSKLEKLIFNCKSKEDLILPDASNLKELSVTGNFEIGSFRLEQYYPELVLFRMSNRLVSNIELSSKKTTTVSLQCSKLDELSLILPELRYLELLSCTFPTKLNLIHCRKLAKITFYNVKHIDVSMLAESVPYLSSLEISSFINTTALKFKELTYLRRLSITYSKLSKLDLSGLSHLEELYLDGCENLNEIDWSMCPNLKRIRIENCVNLKILDFAKLPCLEYLHLQGTIDVDLTKCNNLQQFIYIGHLTKPMDFSGCKTIKFISMNTTKNILNLDLSNLSQLKSVVINASNAQLSLNLSGASDLQTLTLHANSKNYLNLQGCKNLSRLHVETENISNDLPSYIEECSNLRTYTQSRLIDGRLFTLVTDKLPGCIVIPIEISNNTNAYNDNVSNTTTSNQEYLFLNAQNQFNTVSRFSMASLSGFDDVDNNTALSMQPYQADGDLIANVQAAKSISKDHYRFEVLDEVLFINSSVKFTSKQNKVHIPVNMPCGVLTLDKLSELHAVIKNNPDTSLGYFKGTLIPNTNYPLVSDLPMIDSDIIEIYTTPSDAIELFWNNENQQFHFRVKGTNKIQDVEILYRYKQNTDYEKPFNAAFVADKNQLLPPTLITMCDIFSQKHKLLAFLSDQSLTIDERLQRLISYCSEPQFKNEAVNATATSDIDKLFSTIVEQKGCCRHRARAFMVLARYLGIPVRMIRNEQHAFCEIPSLTANNHIQWHRVDLGGAPSVDITPAALRDNIFDKIKQPVKLPMQKVMEPIEQAWEDKYYDEISSLVEKNNMDSITSLLEKNNYSSLSPLIELSGQQNAFSVNQLIIQALNEADVDTYSNYIYIHSPEDFTRYLKPYYLENGQRKQKDGPLLDILQKGGTIVVNWSTFSHTEMASYKSILDAQPTLLGQSVSDETRVIGISKSTSPCSAFLSRCQRFTLDDHCFKTSDNFQSSAILNDLEPIEVDLFNRPNWKEDLFGKIIFQEDEINFKERKLLKAINQNRPLIIYNPPKNDADFTILLHRLQVEGKILHNGILYKIPENLTVKLDVKEHPNTLDNVTISNESPDTRQRIYLGLHNLNECFEQLRFDLGKAETLSGFLKDYNENDNIFYLTDSITPSDWQHLLAFIKKKYPHKHFHFQLAPGVAIGELSNPNKLSSAVQSPQEALQSASAVTFTNDPDFFCIQLYSELESNAKKPLIIDITPQMSFSDLIYETKIESQDSNAKVNFACIEKDVLQALIEGRTIILNGDLSPALYQRLLPLLTGQPPHIYSNGKRIEMTEGRLLSVQSIEASASCVQAPCVTVKYIDKDYQAALGVDDSIENKQILENLERFFHLAQKMPHQGLGRPTVPTISYRRLQRMLNAVKKGTLHPHNPIKGMLHYDYPKNSEEYAYLNVLAKSLLCQNSNANAELCEAKLSQLLKHLNIQTKSDLNKHFWQILNCWNFFNGKLDGLINDKTSISHIPQSLIDVLWQDIQPYKNLVIPTKKRTHVDKRIDQLETLLNDEDSTFIILKGEPGVGKTHTFRQLRKDRPHIACYENNDEIKTWLEDSDQMKVLLLDEANMEAPGTWDFLKGLSRGKKTIYYQGKTYTLTKNHKVLITCNPENFPQRYYHSLFQHYGDTVVFKMPEDDFLDKEVLKPILEPYGLYEADVAKAMLHAYHLIHQYSPFLPLSTRDLESLAQRFIAIAIGNNGPPMQILGDCCIGEFAGAISDVEKRRQFSNELAAYFSIAKHELDETQIMTITPMCIIPQEKAYLVKAIEQDLKIRDRFLKSDAKQEADVFYKQGIVIEGDAGVGKSTLLKAILEKHEFSKIAADTQKKYYEISVGEEATVNTILLTAYLQGSAVILDEINLDENLEKFINQLLTVKDVTKLTLDDNQKAILNTLLKDVPVVDGKSQIKPGFLVFGSQNPGHFAGRKPLSQALRNRVHMLYMDPYSQQALVAIANVRNKEHPNALINAWQRAKAKWGNSVNTRTLYTVLNAGLKDASQNKDDDHQSSAKRKATTETQKLKKQRNLNETEFSKKRTANDANMTSSIFGQYRPKQAKTTANTENNNNNNINPIPTNTGSNSSS